MARNTGCAASSSNWVSRPMDSRWATTRRPSATSTGSVRPQSAPAKRSPTVRRVASSSSYAARLSDIGPPQGAGDQSPGVHRQRASTGALAAWIPALQSTHEVHSLAELIDIPLAAVTAGQVSDDTPVATGVEVVVEVVRGELDDGAAIETDHGVTQPAGSGPGAAPCRSPRRRDARPPPSRRTARWRRA